MLNLDIQQQLTAIQETRSPSSDGGGLGEQGSSETENARHRRQDDMRTEGDMRKTPSRGKPGEVTTSSISTEERSNTVHRESRRDCGGNLQWWKTAVLSFA